VNEAEAIFAQQHKQWLTEPLTKALLAALDKHESSIADLIASSAMDKDKPDDHIRRLATQLATIKQVKKLTYDTPTFVAKCSSHQ